MAIGDILFGLMGQDDPRQKIAAALAGPRPMPMAQQGAIGGVAPQGGPPPQGAPGDGGAPGPGAPQPSSPLPPAAPGSNAAAIQSQATTAPQPVAYQTPPDLAKLYMDLAQRQQSNEMINRGLGMFAAGFAAPQDRASMVQAMSGATSAGGTAGEQLAQMMQLMELQRKQQMQATTTANLPLLAKQLNMPVEQVQAAQASGALDDILKASYASGTPLNHAQVQKAVAEAAEATRKTQTQGDLMASSPQLAAQYGLPEVQVRSLIAGGGWDNFVNEHQKALDTNAALTNEEKQYRAVKADNQARGLETPSYDDWLASGGITPTPGQKEYHTYLRSLGITPGVAAAPGAAAPGGAPPAAMPPTVLPATPMPSVAGSAAAAAPAGPTVLPATPAPTLPAAPIPTPQVAAPVAAPRPVPMSALEFETMKKAQEAGATAQAEAGAKSKQAAIDTFNESTDNYLKSKQLYNDITDPTKRAAVDANTGPGLNILRGGAIAKVPYIGPIIGAGSMIAPAVGSLAVQGLAPGAEAKQAGSEAYDMDSKLKQYEAMSKIMGMHEARQAIGGRAAVPEAMAGAAEQTRVGDRSQSLGSMMGSLADANSLGDKAYAEHAFTAGKDIPASPEFDPARRELLKMKGNGDIDLRTSSRPEVDRRSLRPGDQYVDTDGKWKVVAP